MSDKPAPASYFYTGEGLIHYSTWLIHNVLPLEDIEWRRLQSFSLVRGRLELESRGNARGHEVTHLRRGGSGKGAVIEREEGLVVKVLCGVKTGSTQSGLI